MNELDIWYNLCGFYPEIGKRITSPFRSDRNPSCTFKMYNNRLCFYDGGDSSRNGKSAIQMMSIQNNISFEEALLKVKELGKNKESEIKPKKLFKVTEEPPKTDIKVTKMKWSVEGKKYWNLLGVSDFSSMFQVKGITVTTETSVSYYDKSEELCFCYMFDIDGEFKLYTPFAKDKKFKFMGSVKKWNNWWYNEGTDTLLTLKSSKCFKVVQSIVVEQGWNISLSHFQSETLTSNYKNMPNYSKIKAYKRHLVVMDNDSQGRRAAENCKTVLNSETYFTPYCKDIADFYLEQGREAVTQWLNSILFGTEDSLSLIFA